LRIDVERYIAGPADPVLECLQVGAQDVEQLHGQVQASRDGVVFLQQRIRAEHETLMRAAAQQRLGAGNGPVAYVDLRLVIQHRLKARRLDIVLRPESGPTRRRVCLHPFESGTHLGHLHRFVESAENLQPVLGCDMARRGQHGLLFAADKHNAAGKADFGQGAQERQSVEVRHVEIEQDEIIGRVGLDDGVESIGAFGAGVDLGDIERTQYAFSDCAIDRIVVENESSQFGPPCFVTRR
jgi:hypothetical protein